MAKKVGAEAMKDVKEKTKQMQKMKKVEKATA